MIMPTKLILLFYESGSHWDISTVLPMMLTGAMDGNGKYYGLVGEDIHGRCGSTYTGTIEVTLWSPSSIEETSRNR